VPAFKKGPLGSKRRVEHKTKTGELNVRGKKSGDKAIRATREGGALIGIQPKGKGEGERSKHGIWGTIITSKEKSADLEQEKKKKTYSVRDR